MTTDTLPCTHPAACLRDGACGWCAAVRDARLHLEEVERLRVFGDEWYAAAQDYERRLGCARSPWASAEPTPLEVERDALDAHVKRLREATRIEPGALCDPDDFLGDSCSRTVERIEQILASTPADSLEEHDDRALREVMEACPMCRGSGSAEADVCPGCPDGDRAHVCPTEQRPCSQCGWLRARADAVERGEP